MTQTPAGWYDDPAPAQPGSPPLHRWWDGAQWTEHVQPAPYAGQYGGGQASGGYGAGGYGAGPAYRTPQVPTTPDGQRLAGWWQRVAAYLIDGVVVTLLSVAIGFPFVRRLGTGYADYFEQAMRAARDGTQAPGQLDVYGQLLGPLLGYLAVSLAVNLVYNVGFLKTLQATPGKLALGLRVRLRERPGPLPWGPLLLRWLVQNAASVLSPVPVLGTVVGLYRLLDLLWPLWDDKNQAVHDKAGRTNVVRVR